MTQRPLRAAFIVSAAIFLFGLMEVIVKAIGSRVGVIELVWLRYLVHLTVVLLVLLPSARRELIRTPRWPLQVARSACLFGVTMTNWIALQHLPLADISAVTQLAPLLVTVIAVAVLGERVRRLHWVAIGVGFCGVLLLVRPGGALATPLVVLPFATAIFYSLYQITTRSLGATERAGTTIFYTALVGFVALLPLVPANWVTPSLPDALLVLLLGLMAATSQYMFVIAFRLAPASTLAPLVYTQLLWATVFGALVFGDIPDAFTFVAMGIIVTAGLMVLRLTHGAAVPAPVADDVGPAA